jgi:segregation and condensation protein B
MKSKKGKKSAKISGLSQGDQNQSGSPHLESDSAENVNATVPGLEAGDDLEAIMESEGLVKGLIEQAFQAVSDFENVSSDDSIENEPNENLVNEVDAKAPSKKSKKEKIKLLDNPEIPESILNENALSESVLGEGLSEEEIYEFNAKADAEEAALVAEQSESADDSGEELDFFAQIDDDADESEDEAALDAEVPEDLFIDDDRMYSIIESMLFATDRPLTTDFIKQAFKGTNIRIKRIRKALQQYSEKLASSDRGVYLDQVGGGYQLRTKQDNMDFLTRTQKGRPFKLSGPALEVMSIIAYEQPCIKSRVDEIRAVESGHLVRALMDKGLVSFAGKSELPGKPMLYQTTRKFLEIFGLRSIKELPSLDEIEQLIPDGIGDEEEKTQLSDLTEGMSMEAAKTYSDNEGELMEISGELAEITTSSDFFEQEKVRAREKRDRERAEDIRMAMEDGEVVDPKDIKWLEKYNNREAEAKLAAEAAANAVINPTELAAAADSSESMSESPEGSIEDDGLAGSQPVREDRLASSFEDDSDEVLFEENLTGSNFETSDAEEDSQDDTELLASDDEDSPDDWKAEDLNEDSIDDLDKDLV